jgi:serine/threonine-protein kinase
MQQQSISARFEPGSVVAGRYEIRSIIGRGGMGQVFLAHDSMTAQDVALKTLHGKYAANHDAVARFVREVTLARRLDHPGIVKLHETHNWNGALFYSMEYVQGKTLRRWLNEQKRLDFGSAVRVLCLVADALEHAHAITIHRDLSPENIMVLSDGSVRLLDFGLAKLDDKFKGMTMVGANLGKIMYMAPEQELDAAGVDHRADLYSLGIIFFELLVGRTPLPGRKIRDFRPDLPRETDSFLSKALARNPDDRFCSAREFRAALLGLYKLRNESGALASPVRGDEFSAGARPNFFVRSSAFFRRLLRAG